MSDDRPALRPKQIGRIHWQPVEITFCPAVFDLNVVAFDEAFFAETSTESGDEIPIRYGRACGAG